MYSPVNHSSLLPNVVDRIERDNGAVPSATVMVTELVERGDAAVRLMVTVESCGV